MVLFFFSLENYQGHKQNRQTRGVNHGKRKGDVHFKNRIQKMPPFSTRYCKLPLTTHN